MSRSNRDSSGGIRKELSAYKVENVQQISDLQTNKADKTEVNTLATDKANQSDLLVERARINSFTTLAEGSTTGDAELIDARIGADGVTYTNAGGAIRGQIGKLSKSIYSDEIANYTASLGLIENDGTVYFLEGNSYVKFEIPKNCTKIKFKTSSFSGDYGYAFYDNNALLQFTKTGMDTTLTVDVPDNAVYFATCWKDTLTQEIALYHDNIADNNAINVEFDVYNGAIGSVDGLIDESITSSFTCIYCNGCKKIQFNGSEYVGLYGIAFYDVNKQFVLGAQTVTYTTHELDIPNTACYARICWKSDTIQQIKLITASVDAIVNTKPFPIFPNENATNFLQQMINYADYGTTLLIPLGTYHISKKIIMKSGVSIKGAGSRYTKFTDLTASGNSDTIFGTTTLTDEISDVEYTDFCIDRSLSTSALVQTKGIYVQGVHNSKFERLVFINTPATALGIDYLDNVIINEVECYGCGHQFNVVGMGCAGIGIGTGKWNDESFIISNCITASCGQAGIFIETQGSLKYTVGEVLGRHQVVCGNIMKNCDNYGILMDGGASIAITGNIISGNAYGVGFKHFATNVLVSGNTLFDNATGIQNQNATPGVEGNGIFITSNLINHSNIACELVGTFDAVIANNVIKNNTTKCAVLTGSFESRFTWRNNITDGVIDYSSATGVDVV